MVFRKLKTVLHKYVRIYTFGRTDPKCKHCPSNVGVHQKVSELDAILWFLARHWPTFEKLRTLLSFVVF